MKTTTISQVPDVLDRKDIVELEQKIGQFRNGTIDEERFRHYRLTRGVYGQRQTGVQMFRTKIPFGRLTAAQLTRIANISDQFTNGRLHLTTRQNIQLHHIKLDDSPAIWTALAETGVNAREACGNTVRNFTASATAGIDPDEPFDVTPYVHAAYRFFLRNPICQDMGRKIKIAFSSSAKDSAYTYFHDFGFIPRIEEETGRHGFKVVVGGGLGAQSIIAPTAFEFLPAEEIIPFMAAGIRVFDRLGERQKRFKARLKFLVQELGIDEYLRLIEIEKQGLEYNRLDLEELPSEAPSSYPTSSEEVPFDETQYLTWKRTNVFEQKQAGWYGVHIRVPLGNLSSVEARAIAKIALHYAVDDIRITVNQGLLLRFIAPQDLPAIFNRLQLIGYAKPGFGSTADITSCPGTDTCNLGVTNSTGLAEVLEQVIAEEYPLLYDEREIQIKISGCMNSCGQHMAAQIGFHGSSIKAGAAIIPAMQVVIGGGVDSAGQGFIAEKVIKVPTKRIPQVLRALLDAYETHKLSGERFNQFFQRQGKIYFYDLLKPLGATDTIAEDEYKDWGQTGTESYVRAIGVGECAGVSYDLVSAIISDAKEKVGLATQSYDNHAPGDSLYHSYTAFVIGAKALLLSRQIECNTHIVIIRDFEKEFAGNHVLADLERFEEYVLSFNKSTPTLSFAREYLHAASRFVSRVARHREQMVAETSDPLVVNAYYKA